MLKVLLVIGALLLVGACACQQGDVKRPRDVLAQYESAVAIMVACEDGSIGGGSGVLIDTRTVLTAHHVVDCDGLYLVEAVDGSTVMAMRSRVAESHDLAWLRLATDLEIEPARLGKVPGLGETVCAASAVPQRARHCGEVQPGGSRDADGDLYFAALVQPGNSGGGVYNVNGELVGIVTHLSLCTNRQWCGGRATTLEGRL